MNSQRQFQLLQCNCLIVNDSSTFKMKYLASQVQPSRGKYIQQRYPCGWRFPIARIAYSHGSCVDYNRDCDNVKRPLRPSPSVLT